MKICMPPHRHLMSWPGSCMLPCRRPPSWLGWQLHANGGEDLAGSGLTVALPVRLARVLPGGPARVLPWHAGSPGKDLVEGLVGSFGEDSCLPILF